MVFRRPAELSCRESFPLTPNHSAALGRAGPLLDDGAGMSSRRFASVNNSTSEP